MLHLEKKNIIRPINRTLRRNKKLKLQAHVRTYITCSLNFLMLEL